MRLRTEARVVRQAHDLLRIKDAHHQPQLHEEAADDRHGGRDTLPRRVERQYRCPELVRALVDDVMADKCKAHLHSLHPS